jgi:hypothetical protein
LVASFNLGVLAISTVTEVVGVFVRFHCAASSGCTLIVTKPEAAEIQPLAKR